MKTHHTDEQYQAAIDAACKEVGRTYRATLGTALWLSENMPDTWKDEQPARRDLLKSALDHLPDTPPLVVDGKTPGEFCAHTFQVSTQDGSTTKECWAKTASAVLAAFGRASLADKALADLSLRVTNIAYDPVQPLAFAKAVADHIDDLREDINHGENVRLADLQAGQASLPLPIATLAQDQVQATPEMQAAAEAVLREEMSQPAVEAEQADPYAELKAAHAAGKVIQMKLKDEPNDDWEDIPDPEFGGALDEYRIKPEPETFEAYGKTWTRHTPGDPMPCKDDDVVFLLRKGREDVIGVSHFAGTWDCAGVWDHTSTIGWRYADEPAPEEPVKPWTPAVGDANPVQDMALGGQMYWRDLARQLAEVWWKCHNIGASLQHGDIDTDVSFSVVCERHGGQVFHADTPHNAWLKAEKWLMSPDRANFPAATLQLA